MEELISIIVPIYNVEEYLPCCIDSILHQSYEKLEVILVDDGSTDGCPRICDEYEKKDSRIKVIHKKNGGLSDARNAGIDVARGTYLGFVDSDDYIHLDMYKRLWEELKSNMADIAMCNFCKVYHTEYKEQHIGNDKVVIYNGKQAMSNILDKHMHLVSVVSWGKLYKKELFEGIRFPKGKLHEDEFTTYRLFYKSDRVIYLSGEYYYYRQRDDSIMGKRKTVFSYDALEAYEQMGYFLESRGEAEMLQAARYKYLYMLKEAAIMLKKSGQKKYIPVVEKMNSHYNEEYWKHIFQIKGIKRKVRLWLYARWKISI